MEGNLEQQIEAQLLTAAKALENQVDSELKALERLDDDDLEKLRHERLNTMKKSIKQKEEWLSLGHGKYYEISDEKEFFEETKKSSNVVCHFYRGSTMRCEIVDKHLNILASKHLECKFIKLNVEKAPFLTTRLKIRVIPTLVLVKDSKTKDFVVGFDDLGGHDDFSTRMMEWRIAQSEAINYTGDLMTPPDQKTKKSAVLGVHKKKGIRSGHGDDSSDENDW